MIRTATKRPLVAAAMASPRPIDIHISKRAPLMGWPPEAASGSYSLMCSSTTWASIRVSVWLCHEHSRPEIYSLPFVDLPEEYHNQPHQSLECEFSSVVQCRRRGVNDLADAALAEDSLSKGVGKPQHDHNATPVSAASRRPDIQGLTASCPR